MITTPYKSNETYTVLKYKSKDEWRENRFKGIGSSDSSAVVGLNPYKSSQQLYREKKGLVEVEDISEKDFVKYGIEAEEHLRNLFQLDFPQFKVHYQSDTILQRNDKPYLLASPDGLLVDEKGRLGILEIKTTNILASMQKEKWQQGHIPDNYYIQCLHQMLVSRAEFVCLKAQLKFKYGDDIQLSTRHYWIERENVLDDIDYLEEEIDKFWNNHFLADLEPNLIIKF